MSVPVKHHSKGKVGRRRSHHALKATSVLPCSNCKAPVFAHRVCANCGTMQTRKLRDAASKVEKKTEEVVEKKEAKEAPIAEEKEEAVAEEEKKEEEAPQEEAQAEEEKAKEA